MSKFKLTFSLKQHTPIIHFQHDQHGATLRATEVKPKLDQHIFERLTKLKGTEARIKFHEKIFSDKTYWRNFLIDRGQKLKRSYSSEKEKKTALEHMAFDYKMTFIPNQEKKLSLAVHTKGSKKETENFPFLLANMGGKENENELKNFTLHDIVYVSILSFHTDLLNLIDTYKDYFFMINNFGNRQSKGFGSFTVIDDKGNNKLFKLPYKFHLIVSGKDDLDMFFSLFNSVEMFYRTLRSGINFPHRSFYFKSLAAVFARECLKAPEDQWDKKTIKEMYFIPPFSTKYTSTIKDHFGLSTEETWEDKGATITKSSKTIERYKSPLFFKPVRVDKNKFRIYFKANPIPKAFLNAELTVKKDKKGKLVLKPAQMFKWNDFFNFIFNDLDLDAHVENYDKNGKNFVKNRIYTETIRPIFNEIIKNQEI